MEPLTVDFQSKDDLDRDCLFCQWVRQGSALETCATMAAFADGYPVTEGHLLIVPRRHIADGFAMTEQEVLDSTALIRKLACRIQKDDPSVSGFNIGMNIGAAAGQTVLHAHIHLIPRRHGDSDNPRGGIRGVIDGKRCYP
jgi:diadenosine tetraphosphate (Ap4A) HIT family hydrolase